MKLYDDVNNIPKGSIKDNEEDLVTNISNNVVTNDYLKKALDEFNEDAEENLSSISDKLEAVNSEVEVIEINLNNDSDKLNSIETSICNIEQKATENESNALALKNDVKTANLEFDRLKSNVEKVSNPMDFNIVNEGNTATIGVIDDTERDILITSDTEIKLNGRTLVNLWARSLNDLYRSSGVTFENGIVTAPSSSGNYVYGGSKRVEMFKPSTLYTIIMNVISNTLDSSFYIHTYDSTSVFEHKNLTISSGSTGIFVNTLNTKTDISTCSQSLRSAINNTNTRGSISFQAIILEGDYTNVPISYFEGLQSAKPTKLLSCGKNLLNPNSKEIGTIVSAGSYGSSVTVNSGYTSRLTYSTNLINGIGKYTIKVPNGWYIHRSCFVTEDNKMIYDSASYTDNINEKTINISKQANFKIMVTVKLEDDSTINDKIPEFIQIEKNESFTQYEPYKSDSITLPTIKPLRSLPNGVCDTAELKDDKLVITRNCGEVVLDGSENWELYNTQTNVVSFRLIRRLSNIVNGYGQGVCDKFIIGDSRATENLRDRECLVSIGDGSSSAGVNLIIYINKSKLSTADVNGFKTWLSTNNVTVVYQLATPTIETYDLRTLHLYKYLFANTGAIPLTSNEHKVSLSMRSSIDTNVKNIYKSKEELIKLNTKVNALETELAQLLIKLESLEASKQ